MSEAKAISSPSVHIPRRRSGSDTVIVACNHPNGIILQVYNDNFVETIAPNGRAIRENLATVDIDAGEYVLHGPSLDHTALAGGMLPDYRVIKGVTPGAGYALTSVPAAFWERWLEQNKNSPLVKKRVVYAQLSETDAVAQAREFKDNKSGLEGLNQAGDYRVPSGRGIRKYQPNDNRTTPEQAELPSE